MSIWDNFDTKYEAASPYILLGLASQMDKASHASLGSDIVKVLKNFQDEMSKANTNEYARQLEMMTPEQVLAMEAQGLDPRTAKLGNGFIYNPEDQAIKDAFTNLKSATKDELTGKVKRANSRLTKEQIKKLRDKGLITAKDLIDNAGANSAYLDLKAIQEQADALNSAYNTEGKNSALDYLKGLAVTDPRARALWTGDNSYFIDHNYTSEDAALLGDMLRNSEEGRQLMAGKLKDQYEREQAARALNNEATENAADWMVRNGYANSGLTLNTVDPESEAFANMRNQVRAEQNKAIRADAEAKLTEALRDPNDDIEVSKEDLQRFMVSSSPEEIAAWLQTSVGQKSIGAISKQYIDALEKGAGTPLWQKLTDPSTNEPTRKQIEKVILEGIDKELTASGLQDIPAVRAAMQQGLQTELASHLSSAVGEKEVAAKHALKDSEDALRLALSSNRSSSDINWLIKDWLDTNKSELNHDISGEDLRDFMEDARVKTNMNSLLKEIGVESNDKETKNQVINLLLNYLLPKEVDTAGSNMSVLDYLKAHKGTRSLVTKGKSEIIGGNREMADVVPLMELLLGGRINETDIANDPSKTRAFADQGELIRLLQSAVAAKSNRTKLEEAEELLKKYYLK